MVNNYSDFQTGEGKESNLSPKGGEYLSESMAEELLEKQTTTKKTSSYNYKMLLPQVDET